MVQLFCPEQIEIPLNFPDILKNYAKCAIRTQPYDLLRWSAEYFRSLANNASPMVKTRLEKQGQYGQLTKGYLRVLVEQVGRGFFINRQILENKWKGLCLPQDDLLKYLSLCRMINWQEIHWLKLLAVLVGSINDNITDSIVMLCELLSDDVEGGLARIPIWMFTVVYKYLAYLDCSEEQEFMNGRKVLENGELEAEILKEELPYILSTSSIRKAITQQLNNNPDFETQSNSTNQSDSIDSVQVKDFKFNEYNESPIKFLTRFDKFNSFIFYLQGQQNAPTLEDFEGPYTVTPQIIHNAQMKEEQNLTKREKNNLKFTENINKYVYQDQVNMLKELGPPWSWIYQFTTDNCIEKSYNLVEEQSVLSDSTQELSSVGSFNFLSQKPIGQGNEGSITSSMASINTIEEAKFVADLLLTKNPPEIKSLTDIEDYLRSAEEKGELNVENTDSIYTILCKEELQVLENTGGPTEPVKIDMNIVLNIIKRAQDENTKFKKIKEVIDYINDSYNDIQSKFFNEYPVKETSSTSGVSDIILLTESEKEPTPSEIEHLLTNYGAGNLNDPPPIVKKCMKLEEENVDMPPEPPGRDELETKFEKAGLLLDPNLLTGKVCKEAPMLGLIDGPKRPLSPETPERSSEIDCSGTLSRRGYRSDDSSIYPVDEEKIKNIPKTCPLTDSDSDEPPIENLLSFKCSVPVFPGIGPKISDKTVKDFLRYIKFRAMQQKGLVMPLNFKEEKCPFLLDAKNC